MACSNVSVMRRAVSIARRISGASEVSTPESAIIAIRSSEARSSFATRSSACFRSVEDRSTPLARLVSCSITVSQWPRLEVAALATLSISRPTRVKPSWTRAMMVSIACAPSPAFLARADASLLSPIRLWSSPSSPRTVSPIWCVACRVASARLFTSLATTAKPRPAEPARAASMVALSASRLVCRAIASIEVETFATCASAEDTAESRPSMRPTASTSSAMWRTAVSTTLRDWVISFTASALADCTVFEASAMSWLAVTMVCAVCCSWPNRSDWSATRLATSWTLPATSASSTPRPPMRLASWSTSRSLADWGLGVSTFTVAAIDIALERFRAKWIPVRVKKTRQNKKLEPGSDSIRTGNALGLPEAHAERAPVAAANDDGRGDVLHQHELAAAHVAPIGLQQERLGAACDLLHRTVVEQAAVAAIGVVPDRVLALRQAIVRVVRRQVAAPGPGDAIDDARIGFLHRVLDRGQHAVGEFDIVGQVLLGIGAGNLAVILVHQLRQRDLAASDGLLERLGDAPRGLDREADQRRVGGLDAGIGDHRDQVLGGAEQFCDALVGMLQIGRGQVDAPGEVGQLLDHRVAMAEIGGRRPGDAVDLAPDPGEAVLDAGDDGLDRLRAFAGVLGPRGRLAAFADQIVELAVEPAHGIADLVRGLPRRFRKALHLACDHRKASTCRACARGFDGRVEREQVGLPRDRLDRGRDLRHLRQRGGHRGEPALDAADRLDELGDVAHRGFHHVARLGDLVHRVRACRLHGLRGIGDVMVGGDHGLRGLLQLAEPLGLVGDAAGHLLDIAGDVGQLHAQAADAVGELVDQPFAGRLGAGRFHFHGRSYRHCRVISSFTGLTFFARRSAHLKACRRCGSRPSAVRGL